MVTILNRLKDFQNAHGSYFVVQVALPTRQPQRELTSFLLWSGSYYDYGLHGQGKGVPFFPALWT